MIIGECTICLEGLQIGDDPSFRAISVTPCGHMFHHACLKRWIGMTPTCPKCRGGVHHVVERLFPDSVPTDQGEKIKKLEKKNGYLCQMSEKLIQKMERAVEKIKEREIERAEQSEKIRLLLSALPQPKVSVCIVAKLSYHLLSPLASNPHKLVVYIAIYLY